MPKTATVELTDPFPGHGGSQVTKVVVREPRGSEYVTHGEPAVFARTGNNGAAVLAENDTAIKAYLDCCIVEPNSLLVMSQVSLIDMMKIKQEVLGFFQAARLALSDSGSSF
jgi:hypothetical protein